MKEPERKGCPSGTAPAFRMKNEEPVRPLQLKVRGLSLQRNFGMVGGDVSQSGGKK